MARVLTAQPFPFSAYDNESGNFTACGITSGRYVQGTPTEMMRLYWKVKSFSVNGSYTNYAFNDPNFPNSTSYSGSVYSNATTEKELVCGAGTTSSLVPSGLINSAVLEIGFRGADFYFNSSINQQVVRLYGDFTFLTDQDDAGGITTAVGGSLSPLKIDGFQVYLGGSSVNYDAVGLITGFSASVVGSTFWQYAP